MPPSKGAGIFCSGGVNTRELWGGKSGVSFSHVAEEMCCLRMSSGEFGDLFVFDVAGECPRKSGYKVYCVAHKLSSF